MESVNAERPAVRCIAWLDRWRIGDAATGRQISSDRQPKHSDKHEPQTSTKSVERRGDGISPQSPDRRATGWRLSAICERVHGYAQIGDASCVKRIEVAEGEPSRIANVLRDGEKYSHAKSISRRVGDVSTNENKISDRGRERASQNEGSWNHGKSVIAERPAVRCIAWLDAWLLSAREAKPEAERSTRLRVAARSPARANVWWSNTQATLPPQ